MSRRQPGGGRLTVRVVDLRVLRWCSDVREPIGTRHEIPARRLSAPLADPTMWLVLDGPQPGPANTQARRFGRTAREAVTPQMSTTVRKRIWSEPTTDQKVGGSSPFGRATSKASALRKRGPGAFQDLSIADLWCSYGARQFRSRLVRGFAAASGQRRSVRIMSRAGYTECRRCGREGPRWAAAFAPESALLGSRSRPRANRRRRAGGDVPIWFFARPSRLASSRPRGGQPGTNVGYLVRRRCRQWLCAPVRDDLRCAGPRSVCHLLRRTGS